MLPWSRSEVCCKATVSKVKFESNSKPLMLHEPITPSEKADESRKTKKIQQSDKKKKKQINK